MLKDHNYMIPGMPIQEGDKLKSGFLNIHLQCHIDKPSAQDVPFLHPWGEDPYYRTSAQINKNVISETPKVLFTTRVMMDAEKEDLPPPTAYKLPSMFKPFNPDKEINHEYTQEKFCSFIEEAKFYGMQSPPAKYNKNFS